MIYRPEWVMNFVLHCNSSNIGNFVSNFVIYLVYCYKARHIFNDRAQASVLTPGRTPELGKNDFRAKV